MSIVDIFLFVISIILLIWAFFKMKFQYWKNLGVPHNEPRIPFGNMQGFRRKYHSSKFFKNMYNDFKHKAKFCGMYLFTKPACLITDLDFIKLVLVKDFSYFHDRGMYHNVKVSLRFFNRLTYRVPEWHSGIKSHKRCYEGT